MYSSASTDAGYTDAECTVARAGAGYPETNAVTEHSVNIADTGYLERGRGVLQDHFTTVVIMNTGCLKRRIDADRGPVVFLGNFW